MSIAFITQCAKTNFLVFSMLFWSDLWQADIQNKYVSPIRFIDQSDSRLSVI